MSSVNLVNNAPHAVIDPPVGARLHQCWEKWEALGSSPKVVTTLREGYTLPFRSRPHLTRSPTVVSNYHNSAQQSFLIEALYQLINKNAVEPVQNQNSLGFYNRLFMVPKPNYRWRPVLDLSTLNTFLNTESFKMETPETIRTSLQAGEWVTSIDFKDAYFHIPIHNQSRKYMRFHLQGRSYQFKDNKNLPTGRGVGHIHRLQRRILPHTNSQSVQEVHAFSSPGSVLPVQGPTLWSIHSSNGVHSGGQRGQTHGTSEGYKDPPVPRRLAGESLYPQHLSPAYSNPSHTLSGTRVAGEQGKVRTGPQTGLQLRRLPVRPARGQGQTNRRTLADLDRQDQINTVRSGLPGPETHVPHRSLEKVIPVPNSLHQHLKWWLEESNVLLGQPLHPLKHALQIFTDASKEGWGAHLDEHTARGIWSLPESKFHINHLELKAVFLALKEFRTLCYNKTVLIATDNTTVVAYINKEGGG